MRAACARQCCPRAAELLHQAAVYGLELARVGAAQRHQHRREQGVERQADLLLRRRDRAAQNRALVDAERISRRIFQQPVELPLQPRRARRVQQD